MASCVRPKQEKGATVAAPFNSGSRALVTRAERSGRTFTLAQSS
jgi:hypothetical protein